MKTTKLILLPVVCLILLSNTCKKEEENCHLKIKVVNNSSKVIYTRDSPGYPDTDYYRTQYPNPVTMQDYRIEPGSTGSPELYSRNCYEDYFAALKLEKLMIFVWDAEVLENTPWDTVKSRNIYLKRYDLSLQDLRNIDWTIIYEE